MATNQREPQIPWVAGLRPLSFVMIAAPKRMSRHLIGVRKLPTIKCESGP